MDESRTIDLLERLGALIAAERWRLAVDHGLQPVHLHSLAYLARANRYSDTPAALTDWLGNTKGTVSQTIGVLERKGLVGKRKDSADGRRVHLEVTEEGRRVLGEVHPLPQLKEAIAEFAGRSDLEDLLTILLLDLQQRAGSRTFGLCNSCRFFGEGNGGFQCGMTGEALSFDDSHLICREHEPARSAPSLERACGKTGIATPD